MAPPRLPRKRLLFPILGVFLIVLLIIIIFTSTSHRAHKSNHTSPCPSSSCGNIHITYPFGLSTDPVSCGLGVSLFVLHCQNNRIVVDDYFYVEDINYQKQTIRLIDPRIKRENFSTCPLSLSYYNYYNNYYYYYNNYYNYNYYDNNYNNYYNNYYYYYKNQNLNIPVAFIHCLSSINSMKYVEAPCCGNSSIRFDNSSKVYSYVLIGGENKISDLESSCTVDMVLFMSRYGPMRDNSSLPSIYEALSYGLEFNWSFHVLYNPNDCWRFSSFTFSYNIYDRCCAAYNGGPNGNYSCPTWLNALDIVTKVAIVVAALLALRFVIGFPFLMVLVVYKWQRRHLSMDKTIEKFLQGHHNLTPIQYTYSDIKKMTNNFSQKLGEGGYGTVYKGKLRSGPYVAIKLMEQSMSTEDEFINEVATIRQIHHVNVVQLIGFCVDRSKCALVYEFLPNGSLDRYIFNHQSLGVLALTYEKMFEIVLGVARGIGYLHHGCDMQILHFDIKPHNILLDEKFSPKISDFGLARLHSPNESFINLTAARGTTGYIAPEMFYKNIGSISYKADVYSFGMLLMKIASRRKNMNSVSEDTNQIYFPSWIYDQLCGGEDIEIADATEEERKMVKKIILVALWCIQMRPSDRPSMYKVMEMLEGESEPEMPPKPFLAPHEMPSKDHKIMRTYSVDYIISLDLANN